MMARKIGDVVFPNGSYMKDGQKKTQWLKCGVLLETDKGMRIKLDALPVNMQEGWFQVFEPREDSPAQQQQSGFRNSQYQSGSQGQASQQGQIGEDPDIPF